MLQEDGPVETEHSSVGNEIAETIAMKNINTRESKCAENVFKPKLACRTAGVSTERLIGFVDWRMKMNVMSEALCDCSVQNPELPDP